MNISGAALTKASKNKAAATKLLEYLVSDEAQSWYGAANFEFPVRAGVGYSDIVKAWGAFKGDTLNLSVLGQNNPKAVKLMDRAGWK